MISKISKFELEVIDTQTIYIQRYAEILSAIEQWGKINFYVLSNDSTQLMVPVTIRVIRTNNEFKNPEGFTFLNTVLLNNGNDSFHVFYMWGEI